MRRPRHTARPITDADLERNGFGIDRAEPERYGQWAERVTRHQAEPEPWVLRKRFWCEHVCVHPEQHSDRDREHAGRTGKPDAKLIERRTAGHRESVQPWRIDEPRKSDRDSVRARSDGSVADTPRLPRGRDAASEHNA